MEIMSRLLHTKIACSITEMHWKDWIFSVEIVCTVFVI